MKRVFILFLVLGLSAAASAPYVCGFFVKKNYLASIDNINNLLQDHYVVQGEFELGYLNSKATTLVTDKISGSQLKLQHKVIQGPAILNFNGWLDPLSYIPQDYALAHINTSVDHQLIIFLDSLYTSTSKALMISSIVDFNGNIVTTIDNPSLDVPVSDKEKIIWGGFSAVINSKKDFVSYEVTLEAPILKYEAQQTPEDQNSISLNNMKILAGIPDTKKRFTGQFSFTLGNTSIQESGQNIFELDNQVIKFISTESNNFIDINTNISNAKLIFNQYEIGPTLLDIVMKKLELQAMVELSSLQAKYKDKTSEEYSTESNQILNRVFKHKPTTDVKFSSTIPQGDINIAINSSLGGENFDIDDDGKISEYITMNWQASSAKDVLYHALSEYIIDQLGKKEVYYFETYQDSKIPNPYSMSDEEKQLFVESWVINVVSELIANNYIVEDELTFSTQGRYENTNFHINDKEITKEKLEELYTILDLGIEVEQTQEEAIDDPLTNPEQIEQNELKSIDIEQATQ